MLTKPANFCSLNALEAKLFEFFFKTLMRNVDIQNKLLRIYDSCKGTDKYTGTRKVHQQSENPSVL